MESIFDRIQQIIVNLGITTTEFSKKVGISRAYLYAMRQKGGNISSNIISKIIEVYPQINPDWLLTGNGNMIKGCENKMNTKNIQSEIFPMLAVWGGRSVLDKMSNILNEFENYFSENATAKHDQTQIQDAKDKFLSVITPYLQTLIELGDKLEKLEKMLPKSPNTK